MKTYSIQNFVVPIYLSESSLNALDTTVALSKKHKANIYIFHVTETVPAMAGSQKDYHFPVFTRADVLQALASAYVCGLSTLLINRFVISGSAGPSVEGTYFYVSNSFLF
ncbi:MAG: universal stress protein [Chitinophagaceae bacterium]